MCVRKWALTSMIVLCFSIAFYFSKEVNGAYDFEKAENHTYIFIAIGSAPNQTKLRDVLRATWLKDCVEDSFCEYRFFTDAPQIGAPECMHDFCRDDVVLTDESLKGYTSFGARGHMQLNYSLFNFDFDFYLRVDDDGLLCYHHLKQVLSELPRFRLIWGRYWCDSNFARMDENFLMISRDLALFLNEGWNGAPEIKNQRPVGKFTKLPWNGVSTLSVNIGLVLPLLDANIVGDSEGHFRWYGAIRPKNNHSSSNCVDAHHAKGSLNKTFASCPGLCSRYIWLHHVSAETIERTYSQLNLEKLTARVLTLPKFETNPSGCSSWGKKLPLYKTDQDKDGNCFKYCPQRWGFNTSDTKDKQAVIDYKNDKFPRRE